jgi:hypothetical protein
MRDLSLIVLLAALAGPVAAEPPAARTLRAMRELDQRIVSGKADRDATGTLAELAEELGSQSPDAATVREATQILVRHPYWSFDDVGGSMLGEIVAFGPAAHPVLREVILGFKLNGDERSSSGLLLAIEVLPRPHDAEVLRALDVLADQILARKVDFYDPLRSVLLSVMVRRQTTEPEWVTEGLWSLREDEWVLSGLLPTSPWNGSGVVNSPTVVRALWRRLHDGGERLHPRVQLAIWQAMGSVLPTELMAAPEAPADADQARVLSETAARLGGEAARRTAVSRIQAAPAGTTPAARLAAAGQHLVLGQYEDAARQAGLAAEDTLDREEFGQAHLLRGFALQGLGDMKGAAHDLDIAARAKHNDYAYADPWDYHHRRLDRAEVDRLLALAQAAASVPLRVQIRFSLENQAHGRKIDTVVGGRLRLRVSDCDEGCRVEVTDTVSGAVALSVDLPQTGWGPTNATLVGSKLLLREAPWTQTWDLETIGLTAAPSPAPRR